MYLSCETQVLHPTYLLLMFSHLGVQSLALLIVSKVSDVFVSIV